MYNISKTYCSSWLFLMKLVILGLAFYLIYEKVWLQGEFNLLRQLSFQQASGNIGFLLAILLLGCFNWTFEILKWKVLVSGRRPLEFSEAAKQSFSSLTVSLITPNRLGEYGAKVAYYPKSDRKHIVVYNFLGNMSQLMVTVLFGIMGFSSLGTFVDMDISGWNPEHILLVVLSLTTLALLLVRPMEKKLRQWLNQSAVLPEGSWSVLLTLSTLKYLAFSHQFYFMLLFFGAEQDYLVLMPILFMVYLIASVIPGFLLFDWMVKGSVAVTMFGLAGLDELLVLSVTSLMWVMNFGIPSMIGAYHVIRFKRTGFKAEKVEIV